MDYRIDKVLKMVHQILSQRCESDYSILEISKTGSKLFLERDSDIDYKVICSNLSQKIIKYYDVESKIDIIILDIEMLKFFLDFKIENYNSLYNIQELFKEVIYGDSSIDYDFWSTKEKYLEFLKKNYKNIQNNKEFWWVYLPFKFAHQGNTTVTAEILQVIKDSYNNSISQETFEWLKNQLNS